MAENYYPPGSAGPTVRGGNDPRRTAIIQKLRTLQGERPPAQPAGAPGAAAPSAAAPGAAAPGEPTTPGGNEVAFYLARAFEALVRTGPTEGNMAALAQFITSLEGLREGAMAEQPSPGQVGIGAAGGPPPAPLPTAPLPEGGARGGPIIPPR